MSEPKIGQLIDDRDSEPALARDAIHVAVIAVMAGQTLYPGQRVWVEKADFSRGFAKASALEGDPKAVGIVDPYLTMPVYAQQRFWLFLFPRTITSLRHNWTHPAFEDQCVPAESERWIRNFATSVGLGFDEVLDAAGDYISSKGRDYLTKGGLLEGETVPAEFWDHYETYTHRKVAADDRGSFFSCSC